jgi:hypothetical protein
MVASISNIVEVDPARGNDTSAAGSQQPYKTLTAALANLSGSTLVKLAPGTYSPSTGETFPITIPDGVIVNGPGEPQGQAAMLAGGGKVPNFNGFITLVLTGSGQLRGVTVRNAMGSGILMTSGHPLIRDCSVSRCPQDGIVIGGTAIPQIIKTKIEDNGGNAIRFTDRAKGMIEDCTLLRCQTGIQIADEAAPLVKKTRASGHQVGVLATGNSSPVLRENRIIQNLAQGLWVQGNSQPDLGQPEDPAGNFIRQNGQGDIRNDTAQVLLAVGNDLLPQYLQGLVTLAASVVPDSKAVPPSLLGQLTQGQSPQGQPIRQPTQGARTVPPGPSPEHKQPVALAAASQFPDVQGHWAAAYIEALADRGLVTGYDNGLYRPNEAINRAQFAAMVAASFRDQPAINAASRFVDVPDQHWAANAINQAQRQGFISGYPDQTFRPEQPMARIQAIVAVAQGLKLPPAPANVLSVYRDRAQIPSYATDALAAATQQNLVVNHPDGNQLRPLEPITRGEVATLIYQGLVAQGNAPPLETQATVIKAEMTQGSFPDIQQHWARDFIQGLLDKQLIRGYDDGLFYPDRPMTRAQFAALINGAFQPTPQRPAQAFRDVPENYWAAQAIQAANRGGFMSGFPDGNFAPENAMLRVQTWVALVNGLNLLPGAAGDRALLSRFTDNRSIPAYAMDAVAKATQLKLVVNAPNIQQLNPNRVASRADISAIVYQALVHLQQAPALNHPAIVYP